jgi:hypothetical protein
MKNLSITCLLMVFALSGHAQQADYTELVRSAIKTEKKALIAEVMQFSETESNVFWPIYNEYQEKRYQISTRIFSLVNDFAKNYENMSADKAMEIMNTSNKLDIELMKLEKTYIKKISKVISPQKTLRFFQAENKIESLINIQVSSEIPLLESLD